MVRVVLVAIQLWCGKEVVCFCWLMCWLIDLLMYRDGLMVSVYFLVLLYRDIFVVHLLTFYSRRDITKLTLLCCV